jgi:deazaflavin-dependent oxidoreductase (nitroreductase family)
VTATNLPARLEWLSRLPHWLLRRGVPMGPLALLRTRGRRTGLRRTVPVAQLRYDRRDWIVSPFGATAWVHNVRADGRAELGRGRTFRAVTLIEVDDERNAAILAHYRRNFGIVPFVRQAFTAAPRDGTAAFRREAGLHPVFLVQPFPDPTLDLEA